MWIFKKKTDKFILHRSMRNRLRGARQLTPSALLSSSALAASIALERGHGRSERSSSEGSVSSVSVGSGSGSSAQGSPSFANERYVRDLQPRKMSIVSTGALGHLITQVIEEESSSDLENERIL